MINRHLLVVAVVTVCVGAFGRSAIATTQEQDLLILEGACYYTCKLPSLADSLPGVAIPKFRMLTTANYKGYRATWAVIDGQLFLIGVEGKTEGTGGKRMQSMNEELQTLNAELQHKVSSLFRLSTSRDSSWRPTSPRPPCWARPAARWPSRSRRPRCSARSDEFCTEAREPREGAGE